jgi:hypothetical protein
MKNYQGFKYRIRIRLDGRYHFAVWWADANSRRDEPVWLKTVASKAAAERAVKQWIDDRQPKPRGKRARSKGTMIGEVNGRRSTEGK